MLPLLLLTLTSASEVRVDLVERTTLGISPAASVQLRERLKTTLANDDIVAELVKEPCGDRACLMALAKSRQRVVVGMTVVKNKKGLTIDLEVVDAETVVLQQTFLLSSERLEQSPEAQVFSHQLSGRLVKDRPVAEPVRTLEPKRTAQVEPEPAVDLEPGVPSAAPKAIGIASAGVGVAAIGLLIASAVVKGQLDVALKEQPVRSLTRVQAQQQADLANGLLGASIVGFGLGLAGGATALVLR